MHRLLPLRHHGAFAALATALAGFAGPAPAATPAEIRPNLLIVFTDDQRWDALRAAGNPHLATPNLDALAARGTRFRNAFVTLSICSPSRAALLTGRYNSANGCITVGQGRIHDREITFAHRLKKLGYRTGVTGKWHLGNPPAACGFDFASVCFSNREWYGRAFTRQGQRVVAEGFVEDFIVRESVGFMEAAAATGQPFVLWHCTQVPHMDHRHTWPAEARWRDRHDPATLPLSPTWNDSLAGKPPYLRESRSRTQALAYGYDKPDALRAHTRDYYAAVEQMDASLGPLFAALDRLRLRESTWILFLSDNGWMLGDHGFTSKVLAYEESIRVPLVIAGPGLPARVDDHLVLGIDITATLLELAGLPRPPELHGRSLLPHVRGRPPADWRREFLYEAPESQLGSRPLWAVRTGRWKYIETLVDAATGRRFPELYDLPADPHEQRNLAADPAHREHVSTLAATLVRLQAELR